MTYHADKPNFLEFSVKMDKMTLKVMVNDLHFQYQARVSQDACLEQICWFEFKPVKSYHVAKIKFADKKTAGRIDNRTDAGKDNTPLAWKAKV